MRVALLTSVLLVALLAGCTSGGSEGGDEGTQSEEFQDDLGVQATETKGVLLGVVVDEAVRPLKDADVSTNVAGEVVSKKTDDDGRFAFGELEPGTYIVEVSLQQYASVKSTFEVVANEQDPPVHRLQLTRMFAQAPYTEQVVFDGYIACAYAFSLSSTCVNDYTRVSNACPGGCLRDQEVAKKGGNNREFTTVIGPGWQSITFEMTWEPTSELGKNLGETVSYFSRPDASHWYGSQGGPNPVWMQIDVGVEHDTAQLGAGDSTLIPANGTQELFTFFSAASGNLAVNQAFRHFQTIWYYSIPPEGWSFVNGDVRPF
jgi:hypothetical protein